MAEASQSAEEILNGQRYHDDLNGVDATLDANDVNDPGDTSQFAPRHRAAAKAVTQNYALEQTTLKRLSAEDQNAYRAVSAKLKEGNDPVARLALQKLLFDGKFSGDLSSQLGSVAFGSAPLAPSVDRSGFLADLVQELAVPGAINQGPTGTCGPTAIEMDLASKDPAEYARLAIGVASPEGRVQMKGGMELARPPGTESDDGSGRSNVQRMLGSAMYEISNGDATYAGPYDMNGSWGNSLAELRSQIEGKQQKFAVLTSAQDATFGLQGIDQMLAAKQRPIVQLDYGNSGMLRHYLLVSGHGTDDNGRYVEMMNPGGRVERMREEDFLARLREVQYDPSAVDARTAKAMGWDGSDVQPAI